MLAEPVELADWLSWLSWLSCCQSRADELSRLSSILDSTTSVVYLSALFLVFHFLVRSLPSMYQELSEILASSFSQFSPKNDVVPFGLGYFLI